jgi:anti-sigma B factor antagonist
VACDPAFRVRRDDSRHQGGGPAKAPEMFPFLFFLIVTEHHGQRSLLRLEGELDVCSTDHLRQAIDTALDYAPKTLVADLSALYFTDCAGLAVLAWAHQILARDGRELVITGCQRFVRRLMSLTGFDRYLHISDEPADVLLIQDAAPGRGRQYARSG